MRNALIAIGLAALSASQGAIAQVCSGSSPAHTVALLELYTSEGCSSCPPADRFVSALRSSGLTAAQVVPLSLHVDYWDDIGWKDTFSNGEFTERQRKLAALARSRTVYTPEIFVGAREVRDWSTSVSAMVKRINALPAKAGIAITIGKQSANSVAVEVKGKGPAGAFLQMALVQNDLNSKVIRGENGGRTLHHDFVARQWLEPRRIGSDGKVVLTSVVTIPAGAQARDLAITAFIQSESGEILQAFSLPVCVPAG